MEIVWNSYGIGMESVWCIRLASPEQRAGNTLLRPLRITYTSRAKAAGDSLSQNGVSPVPCQPPHSTTLARQRTLPNTPNALEANVGLRSGLNSEGAKTRRLTARHWARTDCSPTLPVRGSRFPVRCWALSAPTPQAFSERRHPSPLQPPLKGYPGCSGNRLHHNVYD